MNNIVTNTTIETTHEKIPLWAYIVFISILFVVFSSFGISKYQQLQTQKANQTQRSNVEKLQQSLLAQEDVINTNWLHTLNPLVKDVRGSILWSSKKQHGIIKLYNLPKLDNNQQYHLLIYDLNPKKSTPVSALIFHPKLKNVIIPFEVKAIVTTPFKFEIVLEEKGTTSRLSLLLAQP